MKDPRGGGGEKPPLYICDPNKGTFSWYFCNCYNNEGNVVTNEKDAIHVCCSCPNTISSEFKQLFKTISMPNENKNPVNAETLAIKNCMSSTITIGTMKNVKDIVINDTEKIIFDSGTSLTKLENMKIVGARADKQTQIEGLNNVRYWSKNMKTFKMKHVKICNFLTKDVQEVDIENSQICNGHNERFFHPNMQVGKIQVNHSEVNSIFGLGLLNLDSNTNIVFENNRIRSTCQVNSDEKCFFKLLNDDSKYTNNKVRCR